jgi:O-antigen biosynthesis protein
MTEKDDTAADIDDIDVTVVMACYTEKRLDSIKAALTSLRKQSLEPRRVIVAVDNNESLAARLGDEFDWITVVLNHGDSGASATRNAGAEIVDTAFTAFLDDDETADPDWLLELTRPFADRDVIGTGGKYAAVWSSGKPRWFPDEFAWAIGGAYEGLPTTTSRIRNVWSGNMAVRTEAFRQVGGFRIEFGKRGVTSQPEDTDLCIRMALASRGHWMYVPSAVINHDVPADRASFAFFVARTYSEGAGKALMRNNLASGSAIETERDYARTVVLSALRRMSQFKVTAVLQGLVMLLGLASAGAGYVRGRTALPPAQLKVGLSEGNPSAGVRKPALVTDFESDGAVGPFVDQLSCLDQYEKVWVVVRQLGRPVGVVEAGADKTEVRRGLGRYVEQVVEPARSHPSVEPASPKLPEVTVVVCTRERPDDLLRLIESLKAQTWKDFRVLVVDNAPTTGSTADVVATMRDALIPLDYVVEPTPGLSWARNCALRHVETEFVAWIDDDEVADQHWVAEIMRGFRSFPDATAVSGSVVPAELETWAQWWFEQYGGHTKGRGFSEAVFRGDDLGGQSPLYPLPAFGAGANMAFRTSALRSAGGFDVGLGAGSPTHGGEDTLMFSLLLLAGCTVVYQPSAMTRHFHRRDMGALEKQMFGYGVGLTAFYAALLRADWRLVLPLARLAPRALVDMSGSRRSTATSGLPDDFPTRLLALKRRGMLLGPFAYVRARRMARRTGAVG